MKKIILIGIVMLISVTIFAQKRSTVLSVPDTTTAFNMSLSAGDWVFARDSNIIYSLTAQAYATTTIQTATKIRLTGVSMGYWDKDQDTLKTDSAYAISLDNSLFVHKGFIAAGESELRDTTKQTNALLFMNGSNFAGFKFGGATKKIYRLPADDGTAGQFLSTNGNAALSFTSELDPVYANDSIKIVWFRDSTGTFITPHDTTHTHTWVETNFIEFGDSTGYFITPYDTILMHNYNEATFIGFADSTGYFITPYDTTLTHTWVETNFLEFGDSTGYFITPYDTTLTHTWITTNFAGLSSDNKFTGTQTLSDSLYFNNAGDTAYIYNHTDTTHLYSENPFSVETSSVTIGGDLSVTGTLGFITGANTGTITGTTSANRAWTIQDSDGTFAWLTDIPAGAGLWSKTFGSTYPTTLTDSVGIGTNTPSEMLEINGNTKIGGDLSVTGVSKLTDSTYFGNWGGVNTVFGDSLWIYGLNGTKFIENYGNNIGSISISSYNNYTDAIGTSINLYGGIDGFIQFSNNNEPNPIVRMFGDSTHFFSEVVVANDLSVTGTGNFGDTAYFNNAGDTAYIYNHTDTNHLYSENPTKINSPSLTLSGGFYPIEWINVKEYGAAGDSATDDKAAIQLAIDAITADGNGTLFFPEGYYNLESGVTIDGKRNVKIWGQNAVIINGNVSTTTLINIDDCKEIEISGIDIDMGSVASACSGIKVDSCFSLNVNHCDFYNYGQWNAYGLNLSYIASAESAGFEDGFLKINNCSFYNPDTITVSTYDYNSNNTRGSGIYLNSGAEYGIISNNNFDNLSCAVFSHEGANTTFTNNIVRHINHVDNGVIRTTAGIYIDDSGNNGKWNISHNKFNHNYGAIFYSIYDVASNRPIQIINNEFIANAFDPIRFNSAATFDYNNIIGNEFDRCYDYGSFLNYPFTGNRAFIKLAQINYSKISDNTFTNSNGYAIITYANCGYNYIKDNIHETITTAFDSLTGTNDNIYNNNDASSINSGAFNIKNHLKFDDTNGALYLGQNAGAAINVGSGLQNTFVGQLSGVATTTGDYNCAFGRGALYTNTASLGNSVFGNSAGNKISTTGNYNSYFGYNAGIATTTGDYNVMIGDLSGHANTTTSGNVFIGSSAGYNNTGTGNVCIGYQAGYYSTGSDSLYIENSLNTLTPLIGGNFSTNSVTIGGDLSADTVFATSIKVTLLTGSLTDGVPTDAEIDAIIGLTPLQFTGSQVTIKDSDGTGLMYKIESDGTDWYYWVSTKAL